MERNRFQGMLQNEKDSDRVKKTICLDERIFSSENAHRIYESVRSAHPDAEIEKLLPQD